RQHRRRRRLRWAQRSSCRSSGCREACSPRPATITDDEAPLPCTPDVQRLMTAAVELPPEVPVKGLRIIQVFLAVLVAAYLWLFHSANPGVVQLPLTSYFLPPIPVVYVVGLALVLGLAIGFIPTRLAAWRRGRELTKTRRELAQLQV